ncbi:hypothetical protein [Aquimarina algiphila]|uniref:hypothetical protein n=1 Tax=Aquimarina algiphila TaxID=2047982 RepID=UPI002330ABB9|nr:hypothetical protein [Aquimarina algiphila]
MKQLLLKLCLFFICCLAITTFVLVQYGGNVDYFYQKFTTPKAVSMVIGDSRSMQGIQPRVINERLKELEYELPIFNYSLTIAETPIGPLYNKSIEKKLDETSKNGVFIISVTPWMFGSDKNNDHSKGEFREAGRPPHNMSFVNVNPNYEYLFKNLTYFHFKALFRKTSTMHKDGWLEENNLPTNPKVFDEWKKRQGRLFDKMIRNYKVSSLRLNSLDDLIKKLKNHGSVYMVRMPIDLDFVAVENSFYQNFDKDMNTVATSNQIDYFNFNVSSTHTNFKTYDGHHLDKHGGLEFTGILCDSIIRSVSKLK